MHDGLIRNQRVVLERCAVCRNCVVMTGGGAASVAPARRSCAGFSVGQPGQYDDCRAVRPGSGESRDPLAITRAVEVAREIIGRAVDRTGLFAVDRA
jgi:hypothetical protein